MSIVQFTPDNIKTWYGTVQYDCFPLLIVEPYQIIGMAPCKKETTNCSPEACLNLSVFNGDFSNFLFQYPTSSSLVAIDSYKLDQYINNAWQEVATLANVTHGTKFDIGSFPQRPLYGGFSLDWEKVLNLFGEGIFRFRLENVISVGDDLYSLPYNLKTFSCEAADNTVVIKSKENGIYYNWEYTSNSDTLQFYDVSTFTWDDEFRYSGMIDPSQMETEEIYVKYGNFENKLHMTNDFQRFILRIFTSTHELNQRLWLYGFRGSKMTITNYNLDSVYNFKDFDVISAEVAPSFERFVNNRTIINTEIELQAAFDDGLRKC